MSLPSFRASSSRMRVVPSVEWLSTTMTLYSNAVSCLRAESTASAMVFSRLNTGMMTEASTANSCSLKSGLLYKDVSTSAPIHSR